MDSCRNCANGYLRIPKTAHYNYEACAFGMLPMDTYLDGLCGLWEQADASTITARVAVTNHKTLLWGPDIEL
jgi:hypothetical protein